MGFLANDTHCMPLRMHHAFMPVQFVGNLCCPPAVACKRRGPPATGAAPPHTSTGGGSGGKMTVLGGEDFSMEKWREVDKKVGEPLSKGSCDCHYWSIGLCGCLELKLLGNFNFSGCLHYCIQSLPTWRPPGNLLPTHPPPGR